MVRQSLTSRQRMERQPSMPLNPSQCVPMGCSWSHKVSTPSASEMQWALAEELSDSSLNRDTGWQREKRLHN